MFYLPRLRTSVLCSDHLLDINAASLTRASTVASSIAFHQHCEFLSLTDSDSYQHSWLVIGTTVIQCPRNPSSSPRPSQYFFIFLFVYNFHLGSNKYTKNKFKH